MIELGLRRSRASDRSRSAVTRWVGRFEAMEPRVLLAGNGLVGVPAGFGGVSGFPVHTFVVQSVPEDPTNSGQVKTATIHVDGYAQGPAFSNGFLGSHEHLEIDVSVNGGAYQTGVVWPDLSQPGPPDFHLDPNVQGRADFQIPVTFDASISTAQTVTFRITSTYGSLFVYQTQGGTPTTQLLTGSFVVNAPPTVLSFSPIDTPRSIPVPSVDVTFSKVIVPTTFTIANNVTLTRDGANVPLGSDVTLTTTDNRTFTIGNLTSYTTPLGSYVLTVSAVGVKDTVGNVGTGSLPTDFTVESVNAPPRIISITPVTTPRSDPVPSVGVKFSKVIDPTTFTTAALTLTRDGTAVPIGSDVTITSTDNRTFTIGNLTGYTTAPGSYVLTISAAGVKDPLGNQGTGSQSVSFVVLAPDTGPRIIGLQRFGIHNQPWQLVIQFDRPLNAASAGDPNNYQVYSPGRVGYLGSPQDILVPIITGYYNSANNTVTLVMGRPFNLFQQHRIIILGTGSNPITDTNGVALDGRGDGTPGTDYSTIFGRQILKGPTLPTGTITIAPRNQPFRARKPARFRHYQIGG